jgi:prephenate dehydrogenase
MTVEITIVGLGQIGASIGLALASQKGQIKRTGTDLEREYCVKAQKMGAVDQIVHNIPRSVEKADVVILAVPVDQLLDTLKIISTSLRPGVVVLDTTPIRIGIDQWVRDILPAGTAFISATPTVNPTYLDQPISGPDAAHADLFKDSLVVITNPPGANADALKLAGDLTALLGARPYFADPLEADGLLAASYILPELTAAAVINSIVDQPGWIEGRKLAGQAFLQISEPAINMLDNQSMGQAAILNRDNTLRVIDNLIQALYALREQVEKRDSLGLHQLLANALEKRLIWWSDRKKANWEMVSIEGLPTATDRMGRLLGMRSAPKKK